ncbi:partial Homoserine/homoserine lactone efflux protein, partial [Burkholderiaceae bacterium]
MDMLPPPALFAAFCLASLVLAVTPGPAVFYVVTRALAQGRRAGLASVAGVALGNLGNALGAAVGLAALFAVSSLAFSVVKYAGAAYLVYLGWKALRADAGAPIARFEPAAWRHVFRDGFLVSLLNPKTAIFFAAFLPQFMSTSASAIGQSVTLGATFVLIAAL